MDKLFIEGHALVVGVGDDLPNTVEDAQGLADILKDNTRCGYPPDQVKVLTGENATRATILSALDDLSKSAPPQSTVIIYFSGHGYQVSSSTGVFYYLMPFGHDLNQLYKTAIRGDEFVDKLRAIKAQKLVILLDCCHAGGVGDPKAPGLELKKSPMPPEAKVLLAQGEGLVLIASSQEDELSFAGKPFSAFTLALIEALSGVGVAKKDGFVRVTDLAMHAREVVPGRTGGKQHPILEFKKADNFRLAYYASGSTEPKGLPFSGKPEIEQAPGAGIDPLKIDIMFHNPNWQVGRVYQVGGDLTIFEEESTRRRSRRARKPRSADDQIEKDDIDLSNETTGEETATAALREGFDNLYESIKLLPSPDHASMRGLVDEALSYAKSILMDDANPDSRRRLMKTLSQVRRRAPEVVSPPIKTILSIVSETSQAKGGEAFELEPLENAPRYVNACMERSDHTPVAKSTSLRSDTEYYLRVNIGSLSPDSVVENAGIFPFPADRLPPTNIGYWLEVVAVSDDFTISKNRLNLFLPKVGDSWVCSCTPGEEHTCSETERFPNLYFDARTPKQTGLGRIRIAVYYQNNLIQSQLLRAQVLKTERSSTGEVGQRKTRYCSLIDYSLTATLRDLDSLQPRTLNILTNANANGTHKIVINGALDDAVWFNLTDGQMGNAINAVRDKLTTIHVRKFGGQLGAEVQYENLYDANNAKKKDAFIADLKGLASLGKLLWDLLLTGKPDQKRKLREEILKEPSTIQVSRIAGSQFIFPWLLVYDIPVESDIKKLTPCRLLTEWDQAPARIDQEKPRCPYESEHKKNTICPFGFWGFRHTIEQPPSMPENRNLPTKIATSNHPPKLVVGISLDLDNRLTTSHLTNIGKDLTHLTVVSGNSLVLIAEALSNPKLELVYFYCHGQRESLPGSSSPLPYLGVGKGEILSTGDLSTWGIADWDNQHWRETSPLVFINGCHTAEITPESLANFVDTFTDLYAAGVIGTEVLVHQQVAGEAGLEFLNSFQNNKSVSKALQSMRLKFLLKGNLLGLAYTAYCSSDLQLSQ